MANRPRPKRYPLLLPLRVWLSGWGKRRSASPVLASEETVISNISSAGCFFLLNEKPPLGTGIEMEIKMQPKPGDQARSTMVAVGKVVRVEQDPITGKTGVACEFARHTLVRDGEEVQKLPGRQSSGPPVK